MLELGYSSSSPSPSPPPFTPSFRIYVSGDTLLVPELAAVPARYPRVDLLLLHLGGTTVPGPGLPLAMVTMDAGQGVELARMVGAEATVPVHFE